MQIHGLRMRMMLGAWMTGSARMARMARIARIARVRAPVGLGLRLPGGCSDRGRAKSVFACTERATVTRMHAATAPTESAVHAARTAMHPAAASSMTTAATTPVAAASATPAAAASSVAASTTTTAATAASAVATATPAPAAPTTAASGSSHRYGRAGKRKTHQKGNRLSTHGAYLDTHADADTESKPATRISLRSGMACPN